jgi:excisionase family DNA binding protein
MANSATEMIFTPRWYTVAQVAQLLNYGESKVRMLIITGQLRSIKDGRSRLSSPAVPTKSAATPRLRRNGAARPARGPSASPTDPTYRPRWRCRSPPTPRAGLRSRTTRSEDVRQGATAPDKEGTPWQWLRIPCVG